MLLIKIFLVLILVALLVMFIARAVIHAKAAKENLKEIKDMVTGKDKEE